MEPNLFTLDANGKVKREVQYSERDCSTYPDCANVQYHIWRWMARGSTSRGPMRHFFTSNLS